MQRRSVVINIKAGGGVEGVGDDDKIVGGGSPRTIPADK